MKAAMMATLYFSCLLMTFLPFCIGFLDFLKDFDGSGTGQSQLSHCYQCHYHGTCEFTVHGVTCHCASGYTGDHCEAVAHETGTTVSHCETSIHCQNRGTCYFDQNHEVACRCPTGYTGAVCENNNDCKDNIHCLNGGTCYFDQNQAARCTCATGYSGALCASHGPGSTVAHCETRIHCQNGGTCYFDQNHEVACWCPTGYTGAGCQSLSSETTITITTTTTSAASTATTIWATQNPACVRYDPTVRPCRDATPCSQPQFLEVLCPDPDQAHYCPIKCGCCSPGSPSAAILG